MKTFIKEIETTLKDTNAVGNIYFTRHFEWQGMVREAFVQECVTNILEFPVILITKHASIDYLSSTYPFMKIVAKLNVINLRNVSGGLDIRFYDKANNRIVSKGNQTIVFVSKEGKLTKLPSQIYEKFKDYEIEV